MNNINDIILQDAKNHGKIDTGSLAKKCAISRQAAHSYLQKLVNNNKLIKIGSTRGAYYVIRTKETAAALQKDNKVYKARLLNKNLQEDIVYDKAAYTIPIKKLQSNARRIARYAFTEMLNNAIEHSNSSYINISLNITKNAFEFDVIDNGIGIFEHVRKKLRLHDDYEALTEILKGKNTTMPSRHSGEGIFFTSKAADIFSIESSKIHLIINNKIDDIFIEDIKYKKGTKVSFNINKNSKKTIADIFNQYTDKDYKFSTTKVYIKLYHQNIEYISRSQARRLTAGLDKFKTVVLDFNRVKSVGQAFADEIFRVFKASYPKIKIQPINYCKAVDFMIKRAQKGLT